MNSWVFEITTGKMYRPDGSLCGTGYAGGDLGKVSDAVDNPVYESVHDVGPLPEGWYTFQSARNSPALGPLAIPLDPDPENIMYGRLDFYCHGDIANKFESASEGCIIMSEDVRREMEASPVRRIQVVAAVRPKT